MALLGTLQVRMGLDTASFGAKFNGFTRDLEKRAKGFSKGLSGLTNFGSLIGGAGLGAALTQGIRVAGDFETSINQVAAASDLGAGALDGLKQIALDTSKAFKVFDPTQTAEAMLALAKAGITPADQAAGALTATMQLAATEGLDLAFAAEKIAEAMGAFGLKATDTASIADALAGASVASTASVEGLALGLSQAATVARQHGLTLQDTAGTLALFAQNGIKGSDAGTSLKTMLTRLIPETDKANEAMDQYGLSFVNADGSFRAVTEIADNLRAKLGHLSDAQRSATLQTIFGSDAVRAASILTNEGAAGLEKYITATHDKAAAEKLSEARTKGYKGAIAGLGAALERIAINLANGGILQGLTALANRGAALVEKLSALPQWAKNLGLGLAAAAALLPPFALALSSLALAGPAILTGLGAVVAFFTGPWGIAIAAAVGVAILFKDQLISAWTGIKTWFAKWVADNQGLLTMFQTAWTNFTAALAPLWTAIKTAFSEIVASIANAFGTDTAGLITGFKNHVSASLTIVVGIATVLLSKLTEFVQWVTVQIPIVSNIFRTTFEAVRLVIQSAEDRFQLFVTFIKAVPAAVSAALSTLWQTIKAAWDAIDWLQLGKAVVDGIVIGIATGTVRAAQAASSLGSSVIKAAKGILDSNSPSKVFIGIGQDVGDGFVNGIRAKTGEAGKAVKGLVTAGMPTGTDWLSSLGSSFGGAALQKSFGDMTKSIKEGAIQVQSTWTSAMNHVGSAIDNFVKTGKLDFKELTRSIIADLASSALKNAFNGILQGILGITTGSTSALGGHGASLGGTGGGSWLSALGSIFGGLASFAGGGFTGNAPRTGGLDNRGGRLAILHPRETVIDHAAVKRSARGSRQRPHISVPVEINLQPGVSKEELAGILPMLKRDIIQTIPTLIARGGRYAGAFGQ